MASVPDFPAVNLASYAAPASTGDDKFARRNSWNKFMGEVNAAKDDVFVRRASWNNDQIRAQIKTTAPAF